MLLSVTARKRDWNRIRIILNCIIQVIIPSLTLILWSSCWGWHIWYQCGHVQRWISFLWIDNFWGTYFKSRWCFSSSWTFFLLGTQIRMICLGWYNSIFGIRKNLSKLLDCGVEYPLFVVIVHNFNWIQSLKVSTPNHILIDTIRPLNILIHFQRRSR